ncbi:MAG: hypothetical protein ACYS14_07935 [Planctomycetota bacterium]
MAKRKAQAKNNSPDSQELTCNPLIASDGRSPRRRWVIGGYASGWALSISASLVWGVPTR